MGGREALGHASSERGKGKGASYAEYNREIVFILGLDTEGSTTVLGEKRLDHVQQAYKDTMDFYRRFSLTEVRTISFEANTTEKMRLEKLKDELESLNAGDLATFVFAGEAGLQDANCLRSYSMTLKPYPQRPVNFYSVFALIEGCEAREELLRHARQEVQANYEKEVSEAKAAGETLPKKMTEKKLKRKIKTKMEEYLYGLSAKVECDILLIIDATYPDKITKHLKRKIGSTTVFARPKVMTNGKGNVVQLDGEFLTLLYNTLYLLVENSNGSYSHWKSNPTLAQALSWIQGDKMTCKAHQDFSDEAKNANGEKFVTRPVLDVASARKTGKLQFLQEYYQGQPPATETPSRMDRAKREAKRPKDSDQGEANDVMVLSDSSDSDEPESSDDELFVRETTRVSVESRAFQVRKALAARYGI